jgi:hypothetical protein
MGWKEDFDIAVKDYFGIPHDADIHIEDECYYQEGCPTCGGTYEFTVRVWYYGDTKKYHTFAYKGKMTDFIRSLGD